MIHLTLAPDLARLLHEHGTTDRLPESEKLPFNRTLTYLKRLQAAVEPVFPNATDEQLLPHFTLFTTKPLPENVLATLLTLPGVEGAYSKPDDYPAQPP